MARLSLYSICLKKVSCFLNEGMWEARRENNPFKHLPLTIICDLMSSIMLFQQPNDFINDAWKFACNRKTLPELKIQGLELLLTSEMLIELKIQGMNVEQNFERAFTSLGSGCQNLEVLTLRFLVHRIAPGTSEALEKVLNNSPNLKIINCEIVFDLKALRNCKKLQSVVLEFKPRQPWCDFLEEENGCFKNLDSLELFSCPNRNGITNPEVTGYIVNIIKHCPALISLRHLDTTKALTEIYRTGILPFTKLRYCQWSDFENTDGSLNGCRDASTLHPEMIQDSVTYQSAVQELYICLESIESIGHLNNLRNLVFLVLMIFSHSDCSVLLINVFKDIGLQLKYLCLLFYAPTDISLVLQHCPNIEALKILAPEYTARFENDINLPNLKCLYLRMPEKEHQVLLYFSDCHNLTELFMLSNGCDDVILDRFLSRNSLYKLKYAYFGHFGLTIRGFKKFLLNAPELEIIQVSDSVEIELIKIALRETNHKANSNRSKISLDEDFFNRRNKRYNF